MLKIGFVGLDTSHVVAFAEIINDATNPNHVAGGKVVAGWPGGSPDFALSRNRVAGFTATLREKFGVSILDSPEAVAEASDVLFIESADGRVHLEQLKRTLPFGKPTFIDKPFAVSLAHAREMVALADKAGVPLMSSSSLRYAEELQNVLKKYRGGISGISGFGPMNIEPTQPGFFWYGCHGVEAIVATLGTGCREVRCICNDGHDLLTAVWKDGRVASYHGMRGSHHKFGFVAHHKDGPEVIDSQRGRPGYAGLLAAIMDSLPQGRSDVPAAEMVEVVAIMEAANISRSRNGEAVDLAAL